MYYDENNPNNELIQKPKKRNSKTILSSHWRTGRWSIYYVFLFMAVRSNE